MPSKQERAIVIYGLYEDFIAKGVKKSERAIDDFEKKAQKPVGKLRQGFMGVANAAGKHLGAALKSTTVQLVGFSAAVAAVGKGVAVFRESERAMTEVATISEDVAANLDAVGDEVDRLARRYGKADTEIAKGLYQTISSGVAETADALEVLDTAVGLSIAGLADTAQTVDLVTSTINAYKLETREAERIADVYFSTVRRGKTTIEELGASMSQVTPTAAALGVDLEQVSAAIAAITLSGAPTSAAVTQVNSALTALLKKAPDIDAALRSQGSSGKGFDLVRLRAEGLIPILEDLRRAYAGNEEGLTQLLGRQEATLAVFNLTGDNAAAYQDILDDLTNSTGAYEAALDRVAGTQDSFLSSLSQGARQGLGVWGEAFVEAFFDEELGTIPGLERSEEAALKVRLAFEKMAPAIEGVGAAMAGVADATGAISEAVSAWAEVSARADLESFSAIQLQAIQRFRDGNLEAFETAIEAAKGYRDALVVLDRNQKTIDAYTKRIEDMEAIQRAGVEGFIDLTDATSMTNEALGEMADKVREMERVRGAIKDAQDAAVAAEHQEAMQAQVSLVSTYVERLNALAQAFYAVATAQGASGAGGQGPLGYTNIEPSAMAFGPEGAVGPLGPQWQNQGQGGGAGPLPAGMQGPLAVGQEQLAATAEAVTPISAAFNELAAHVEDTDARLQEFTENAIAGFSFGMTDAIFDFISGTESAGDAFGKFAAQFLADIGKMILQQQIMNALSGAFGGDAGGATSPTTSQPSGGFGGFLSSLFANGGIAQGGFSPIPNYANGTVATKPHVGIVGEGVHNEAIVPMPGGKAIPVVMHGGGGGGNAEVSITVQAMDGADAMRVLVANRETIRDIIQDAMHRDNSFRSSMSGSVY